MTIGHRTIQQDLLKKAKITATFILDICFLVAGFSLTPWLDRLKEVEDGSAYFIALGT